MYSHRFSDHSRRWPTAVMVVLCLIVLMVVSPISPLTPLTYVEVSGTSMEPAITSGDLIVLGRSGPYRVGDVVAFHDVTLGGALIVHRIVDERDGRFVTRGDSNDFIDEHRPLPDEIVGRQILRIASGAEIARRSTHPIYFGLVAAISASLLMPAFRARRRRRRDGDRRRTEALS